MAVIDPSPDGQRVRIEKRQGDEPRLQIWNADGWRRDAEGVATAWTSSRVADVIERAGDRAVVLGGRRFTVDDAVIVTATASEDGRWLAAATTAGRIDVFDTRDGRTVARLHGHRQRVTWLAFRRDALWSAGWDGAILRWSVRAFTVSPDDVIRE